MTDRFDKNYTDQGYIMNYFRLPNLGPWKKRVLQFRIELEDITPAIWRVIQVPADYNFWDLHVAIQDAMGWLDCHLHYFEIKPKNKRCVRRIGIPDFERTDESFPIDPGWEIAADSIFNDLGLSATYLYDFGDSWKHKVTLEGHMHRYKNQTYPVCVSGKRACPPEDCGGVPGYMDLLEVLSNPRNPEYKSMREWAGDYDPESFSPEKVVFSDPQKRWREAFF